MWVGVYDEYESAFVLVQKSTVGGSMQHSNDALVTLIIGELAC
jgi:hypothetical protein